MKIQVTQEDIDNGVSCLAGGCAVALALRRHFPEAISGNCYTYLNPSDGTDRAIFYPNGVATFITNFDDGKPVEPFEFELEVPDSV